MTMQDFVLGFSPAYGASLYEDSKKGERKLAAAARRAARVRRFQARSKAIQAVAAEEISSAVSGEALHG